MTVYPLHRSVLSALPVLIGLIGLTGGLGCTSWPSTRISPGGVDLARRPLNAPEPAGLAQEIEPSVEDSTIAEATDLGLPGRFPEIGRESSPIRDGATTRGRAPATGDAAPPGRTRPEGTGESTTLAASREQVIEPTTSVPALMSSTASVTMRQNVGWTEVGRSSGGRPIEALQLQDGPECRERIVFVSSLAGNEPESVLMIERLATRLSRILGSQPDEEGHLAVLLVRAPNPDGLVERISTNIRGVDLNRNFPSPRYPVSRTSRTGPEPGSEPETQALMSLLEEFQPTRLIHVKQGSGVRGLLLADQTRYRGFAARCVDSSIDVACYDGEFKAGSIEEYVRSIWETEILTFYLPATDMQDVVTHLVFACLGLELPELIPAADPDAVIAHPASSSERIDPDGRRGFVEILPPPHEHGEPSQSSRYYELPPPPE